MLNLVCYFFFAISLLFFFQFSVALPIAPRTLETIGFNINLLAIQSNLP